MLMSPPRRPVWRHGDGRARRAMASRQAHPSLRVLRVFVALSLWLSGIAVAVQPADGNWPGWRGDGSGISAETSLPRSWDSTNGILWRTPLPGEGSSSPVVWGTRVFVTASTAGGTNRLVLCLDSRDGHLLWQRQVVAARIPRTDPKGGYAPATPVTDGKRLFVFFDAPGLVAFDLDGTQLWTLPLGPFKTPYNVTASPILFRDRVIQCCDQSRDGFLLAADSDTGKVLWKTPRTLGCHYATPLLVAHQDVWQVVASGSSVKGYDLDTGSERWSCAGLTDTVAPSPVLGADGLVYATSGRNGPSLAIDPGGTGDVKETHMRLQVPAGGPYVPSPLFAGVLILPDDDGVVRIVTAQGVVRVAARLHDHFTASPVLAGTCIYWPAESGTVYVLDAGARSAEEPALPVIAANALGERCLASPAIAGNCLFIRTTRSTIFAPLDNLGAIIVDEEHDGAYKQDRNPRYNARDTAVMRAMFSGAICVLGSATPSFESYSNAVSRKYTLINLPERVDGAAMPRISLIWMRESPKASPSISELLYRQIALRLEKNEQVILLQNRRGFAGSFA